MSATDLETARRAVLEAMQVADAAARVVGAHTRVVSGWLHREDGSWASVDERGRVGPVFAVGPVDDSDQRDLFGEADAALAVLGEPVVIDVDPLYSPALRHVLEVAERVAAGAGAATVEIAHVEIALARHRDQSADGQSCQP